MVIDSKNCEIGYLLHCLQSSKVKSETRSILRINLSGTQCVRDECPLGETLRLDAFSACFRVKMWSGIVPKILSSWPNTAPDVLSNRIRSCWDYVGRMTSWKIPSLDGVFDFEPQATIQRIKETLHLNTTSERHPQADVHLIALYLQ